MAGPRTVNHTAFAVERPGDVSRPSARPLARKTHMPFTSLVWRADALMTSSPAGPQPAALLRIILSFSSIISFMHSKLGRRSDSGI
jgi:hypothetical protein